MKARQKDEVRRDRRKEGETPMTMTDGNQTWEQVRDELHRDDPELREAYEDLAPAYLVARELVAARSRLRISQGEVAKRAGTTQAVVSRIERMETIPNLRTVHAIARALGCRLDLRFVPEDSSQGEDSDAATTRSEPGLTEGVANLVASNAGFTARVARLVRELSH